MDDCSVASSNRKEWKDLVQQEALVIDAPLKHARSRPKHIPRQISGSYGSYCHERHFALQLAVKQRANDFCHWTGLDDLMIESNRLTCYFNSQSKLSQQELSDLQKATHFDKKELQQWYKGQSLPSAYVTLEDGVG